MKVVLFCGGLGTRLRDYTKALPKPLVPIGERPIMWHLMKYYAHFGHKDFILCLGYKSNLIKEYFLKYDECVSNDFMLTKGKDIKLFKSDIHDWKITFVETGLHSNIGERLKAVEKYLGDDEMFMANYSDSLTDLDLKSYIQSFSETHNTGCFLTVPLQQSFHSVVIDENNQIEKIQPIKLLNLSVNGGFFIFRKNIFEFIQEGEELVEEPFQRLLQADQLMTQQHKGFWKPMDSFKDKIEYDRLYANGESPWQLWNQNESD